MHLFPSLVTSLATLVIVGAITIAPASAQSHSPARSPLLCYRVSCFPLIDMLKECQVAIDPLSGNLTFPLQSTGIFVDITDKCLCKQAIIDAY
ncbi:hypothetical protein BGZ51_002989, partial [Haplosporangium sp. Z 767]